MDNSIIYKEFYMDEILETENGKAIYKEYEYSRARSAYVRRSKDVCEHSKEEWLDLCQKYDFKCCRCHSEVIGGTPTKDHIIPISIGGSDSIKNIQPLCRECNTSKFKEIRDYR